MKSTLSLRFSLQNKTRSLRPTRSRRFVLLTLVSLVAVAALLGVVVSASRANRAAKARAELAANSKSGLSPAVQNDKQRQSPQSPQAPLSPTVSVTLTDNVTLATKVAPGANINYTAVITNNGAATPGVDDATNLNYSANLSPNTTLVPGSIHASPIAFNDTYNWVGNTFLDTSARALPTVTANDVAVNAPAGTDNFTLTAAAGATALGGAFSLAATGHYTYTPPLGRPTAGDGATVQDSFTYTITNNIDPSLTSTGTVRINLTGRVWYLQAGAAGDGRSNTPSSSPAAMSTAADKSTDVFYIFSNAASLNGPFSVDAGQQVLGQGVNLVVSAITLFNSAAPTPTTTNTAGSCVALAGAPGNNTLSGFNIGNCTGGTAITGANVGTLNVSTLSINTNGGALDLTGVGAPTVSVVLGGTTSTGGAKNVNLAGLNGTITLAGGALSGATGNSFDVNGGTAAVTYSGTISNSGARQVNVANKTGGSVALSGAVGGTGTGINLTTNAGATISFTGGIAISSGANAAFTATGGGTVTATQNNTTIVNTLATTTGTALNVANTTIGAAHLTFRSITSNGAASGIILNTTGATGSLIVSGNGGACSSVATCTGGAIQSAATGVSLNSTTGVSIDRMLIQTTTDSGVSGVAVTNFTFTNGKIDSAGNATFDSAIAFNGNGTGLGNNIAGTLTITGNTLTNSFYSGVDVQADNGTVSNANISNNTITNTNQGLGINFNGANNAVTAFNLQNATINQNNISGIGGTGIQAQCSSSNVTGPGSSCGTPGDGTKLISITNNSVLLQPTATQGITITATGGNSGSRAKGNFLIQCNGRNTAGCTAPTAAALGSSSQGTVILIGNNGFADMTAIVNNNAVVATHTPNLGGGNGIAGGNGVAGAGNAWTPQLTLTVTNNSVTGTDGNGILLVGRGTSGFANMKITNNTVGTPTNVGGTARESIRVDAGNAASADDGVCVTIASNTCAIGSNGAAGIGIRKQGVVQGTNDFGITGLAPSPATGPQAAAFVVTQNPAGNGCDNISGSAFQSCATAPLRPDSVDDSAMNMVGHSNDELVPAAREHSMLAMQVVAGASASMVIDKQAATLSAPAPVAASEVKQAASSALNAAVLGKAIPKATAAEVARIYRSERPISHHAVRNNFKALSQEPNAPTSGENVTLTPIAVFPAGGKSITIKYSASVNTPPAARSVNTQGNVTASNVGFGTVPSTDPETGTPIATVTNIDTLMTWNGSTSTDWNLAGNWTQPAGGLPYAPGVSNPAVNDVAIPNVGLQPTISATDIGIFSLNISNGRTLTITNPRVLTIGGAPGGDLTLDGIISGGNLNLGTGAHVINNAGGTGSLSSTNVATVLSGATVTLNSNLQAGAFAVNAGGSMTIATRTLSLNGSGPALVVPGGATFTTTTSTVVFNGTAAQQAAGIAYNNLTINNLIGAHLTGVTLTGNASVAGVLTLTSSDLATGANTLTMPAAATSAPASGASDVVGNVKRTGFVSGGAALSFGNPLNTIRINSGTAPTDINILLAKNAPTSYTTAVLRSYTITPTGGAGITATVRLHYRQTELNGNLELPAVDFNLRRLVGTWKAVVPTARNTGVAEDNWLESNAVTAFSEWTFAALSPSATNGVVTGRIVDDAGHPVEGAVVRMEGTQTRKFITDANGVYRFDNVETNGFYTVTPSRANYSFNPSVRAFSQIGETTQAAFGATLSTSNFDNPLDTPEYFVRQHYVDFLGREPDEAGFNFWSDQIIECGTDQNCIERRRENVSAAYFFSIEFQKTGGLVDGLYRATYGTAPSYAQFMPDTRTVGQGVQVNKEGWETLLQTNTTAFVNSFVNRPAFHEMYDSMNDGQYIDALISHTGVSFTSAERDELVSGLGAGSMTRAEALRSIAENQRFVDAKLNETFVMMEYMGYLRRDPDASGFAFWLNKLNQFGGNFEQAEMVKAFIVSGEYRDRFPR
ncbi:MAG TPA: DUF4214 domain-containing protein [Pyrinomonadaceae bacterium]|nr:DUF4214 domain-containing protein [Pyrinomonadaceae bacterium]